MSHRSVFVIHHGALGDLVTAFPLLGALKDAGLSVHLLCQGHLGTLAQALGRVEKAHALESGIFASLFQETPDHRAQEAVNRCDAVLAITRSDALVLGISRFFKKSIHCITPRPEPAAPIHVAKHLLLSCAETGLIKIPGRTPESYLKPIPARKAQTKKIWIHPGAGSPIKRWPLSRFIETASLLREKGWDPAFLTGPAEASLEAVIEDAAPSFRLFRISEVIRLLEALTSGKALIGNDSGVSHLAAFLGLATVAVFGPTDPNRWKPLGPAVAVVRGASDCGPCFETGDEICREAACFDSVTPERVLNAFLSLGLPP